LRQILSAMESFWNQAPRQLQLAAPEPIHVSRAGAYRLTKRVRTVVLGMTVAILTLACLGSYGIGREFAWRSHGAREGKPSPPAQAQLAPAIIATGQAVGNSLPASTDLPKQPESNGLPAPPAQAVKQPLVRIIEPELIHEIALEIPRDLRDAIKSAVRVDVTAALDDVGHVSDVKLTAVTGTDAQLVVQEALSAARQLRFQPAREGKTNVRSKVAISFSFTPEPSEF
jgi:hypothetical protein